MVLVKLKRMIVDLASKTVEKSVSKKTCSLSK